MANNVKKTQLLTLSLIATLLSFTPLFSSSLRSTYLYFIINVLIVVLGAEAGFLSPSSSSLSSSSSSSLSKTNHQVVDNTKEGTTTTTTTTTTTNNNNNARIVRVVEEDNKNVTKESVVFEKSVSEKIRVCASEVQKMIKKCPSSPSIFFIGEDEDEDEVVIINNRVEEKAVKLVQEDDEEENDDEDNNNNEELFVKAETFIVNFYKQLKMQREESWKKIHGFNKENRILVN